MPREGGAARLPNGQRPSSGAESDSSVGLLPAKSASLGESTSAGPEGRPRIALRTPRPAVVRKHQTTWLRRRTEGTAARSRSLPAPGFLVGRTALLRLVRNRPAGVSCFSSYHLGASPETSPVLLIPRCRNVAKRVAFSRRLRSRPSISPVAVSSILDRRRQSAPALSAVIFVSSASGLRASASKSSPPARTCYDEYLSGLGLRATGGCKPRQVRKEATVAVRFVCRGLPGAWQFVRP